MELHGENQMVLEMVACVILACYLSHANVFFFYLLVLLPLLLLFEDAVGE